MNIFPRIGAAIAIAVLAAAPAAADGLRVEARGGILLSPGRTDPVAGFVGGYEIDLGEDAVIGAEISADKVLAGWADTFVGLSGRGGVRLGADGVLFAAGGYTFRPGDDAWHAGGGYEHMFSQNGYLKVDYRHWFDDLVPADQISAGIGLKF